MHRKALIVAVCALLLVAAARQASAQVGQPWTDRAYANINLGFETTSGTLNDVTTFQLYDENGTKGVESVVDSGPFVDFSFGARVWRNISVGLAFHQERSTGEAAVTAIVPNPLFFNRNRNVALSVADLHRSERAMHLQFGYMLLLNENLDVHLFVGPSFFRLRQDVVSDVTFTEPPDFPFATVSGTAVVTERKRDRNGINIGADVAYTVYETRSMKLAAGMFVRFSGASVKVQILQNDADSDVGGLQVGFGARVRF